MPYLIDGHNLIAILPDISLQDPNDEMQLVLKLRSFATRTGKRCQVVFDHGLPGGDSPSSTKSVKVTFAAAYHSDADRIIKERIRKTKDAGGLIVVSSDNAVLGVARQCGAQAMRSSEFARILRRPAQPDIHAGTSVNPPKMSSDELDEWLTLFGGES